VLDASALLALLKKEPGHEAVLEHLEGSVMSAVNWCEVLGRDGGMGELRDGLAALGMSVLDFTIEDAARAGAMYAACHPLRIGLADRACLSLADRLGVPVITADHKWDDLSFGPTVIQIR
jgi:ribonuclease VapC